MIVHTNDKKPYNKCYIKYGVVTLCGIILSESGTALKSLASREFGLSTWRMDAMLPHLGARHECNHHWTTPHAIYTIDVIVPSISLVPRFPGFFGSHRKSWEAWGRGYLGMVPLHDQVLCTMPPDILMTLQGPPMHLKCMCLEVRGPKLSVNGCALLHALQFDGQTSYVHVNCTGLTWLIASFPGLSQLKPVNKANPSKLTLYSLQRPYEPREHP